MIKIAEFENIIIAYLQVVLVLYRYSALLKNENSRCFFSISKCIEL